MRARLSLLAAAIALTGPTGLVVSSQAAPLDARPLCGDSTGRTYELSDGTTPVVTPPAVNPAAAVDAAVDDVVAAVEPAGRHHKPKHKPVPPPKPPVVIPPPPPPPPPSVRIATVNVLHGLDNNADRTLEHRLAVQAAQLAAAGVDVIGAQEVSRTKNHGVIATRLAKGLEARTGQVWQWCFFATNPYFPGEPETRPGGGGPLSDQLAAHTRPGEEKFEEGVAILSRYPMVAASAHRLPSETPTTLPDCEDADCATRSAFQSRGAVWARVRTNIGEIDVFSAHTSGLHDQHSDLTGWVAEKSPAGRTAVVTCDCNATPGEELAPLTASYYDTFRTANPTATGYTSDQRLDSWASTVSQRIDFVWLRKRSAHRTVASRLVLNQSVPSSLTSTRVLWPSDHYGVLTTLTR